MKDVAAFTVGAALGLGVAAVVLVVGMDMVSRAFTRVVWG